MIRTASRVVRETSPEFYTLTLRKDIFDVANRVVPPAVSAWFMQKLLEWSRDNPSRIPSALVLMVIVSAGWGLILRAFGDYYRWHRLEFLKVLRVYLEDAMSAKSDSLDIACASDVKIGQLRQKAQRGSYSAILRVWESRRDLLDSSLTVLVAFIALLLCDRLIALLMMLPIAVEVMGQLYQKKIYDAWKKGIKGNEDLSEEYQKCLTDKKMMIQVRLFGAMDYVKAQYKELREAFYGSLRELHLSGLIGSWAVVSVRTMISTGCVLLLIWRITQGMISLGSLLLFLGQIGALSTAVGIFVSAIESVLGESESFDAYDKYLQIKPFIDERHASPLALTAPPRLTVENVTFSYEGSAKPALIGCTLTIEPQEKIVIIGANGSGKTTLANLFAKLYLAKEGNVSVNGMSLATITQKSWLSQLLYVTWGNEVPDFPIEEVVAGVRKEEIDIDRLVTAAKITGVHEFVKSLPWKYVTPIGSTLPGGRDFSTGQLQRIRLACGIYRLLSDSVHIAVFDEPMANCDHEIRDRFYGSIREFAMKTVIVIAHDPLYLHHFNRVIVMKEGVITDDIRGEETVLSYKKKCVETHK